MDTPAAKRTREEIDRDAARSRDAHRRGHGHHQKRGKKVAAPVDDEAGAKVRVHLPSPSSLLSTLGRVSCMAAVV